MTQITDAPARTIPRARYWSSFVAILLACAFAQGCWTVADAIADGRAPLEPGVPEFVNWFLSMMTIAFIPMALFSLPTGVPLALIGGVVAFATERVPPRAIRFAVTAGTIMLATAALGFFQSVVVTPGAQTGAAWAGDTVLAYAAFGGIAALPGAWWSTRRHVEPPHDADASAVSG